MENERQRQINPEIKRETEERRKAQNLYNGGNMPLGIALFSTEFFGGTASPTESTGLIQIIPEMVDDELCDSLSGYRQTLPILKEDEE